MRDRKIYRVSCYLGKLFMKLGGSLKMIFIMVLNDYVLCRTKAFIRIQKIYIRFIWTDDVMLWIYMNSKMKCINAVVMHLLNGVAQDHFLYVKHPVHYVRIIWKHWTANVYDYMFWICINFHWNLPAIEWVR